MCRILNARQVGNRPQSDRVYVGRPSKWGNPFVIGRDGTRDEVIAKYRAWILRQPSLIAALPEEHRKRKDQPPYLPLGFMLPEQPDRSKDRRVKRQEEGVRFQGFASR